MTPAPQAPQFLEFKHTKVGSQRKVDPAENVTGASSALKGSVCKSAVCLFQDSRGRGLLPRPPTAGLDF